MSILLLGIKIQCLLCQFLLFWQKISPRGIFSNYFKIGFARRHDAVHKWNALVYLPYKINKGKNYICYTIARTFKYFFCGIACLPVGRG